MKRGFDHPVLCVSDLDSAVSFYKKLGFTATPRAHHDWGTDNCLIQLDGCFVELLTVARPEAIFSSSENQFSFGEYNQRFLSKRQGMSMLAFASQDTKADRIEFQARGLKTFDNFYFERQAKLPSGESAKVAFTLAFVQDPNMKQAVFFTCQQHAPEYFWKPEYQLHTNGAVGISSVYVLAKNPVALVEQFGNLQENHCVDVLEGELRVVTPHGVIVVITYDEARQRFSGAELPETSDMLYFLGLTFKVKRLSAVSTLLNENGVLFNSSTNGLWISPQHSFGTLICFSDDEMISR